MVDHLRGLDPNAPVLNKSGFQAVIASCLRNVSSEDVVWNTDAEPFISDQDRARVVLDLFSLTGLAWDERRRVYGLPGYPPNALVTVDLGNRTLVITVRAEVFDAHAEASELLDQIRSNIYSEQVTAELNAINLAFVSAGPSTRLSYRVDQRIVNASIADFTFAGVAQHVTSVAIDGSSEGVTWIERVNADNKIPGTLGP